MADEFFGEAARESWVKAIVEILQSRSTFYNVVATLAAFLLITGIRVLVNNSVDRASHLPLETKRKWVIRLRTSAFLLFFFATCAIWANELETFAFSLAALAAAIAIATKEFILSFCGTWLKPLSQSFSHGDRIEIAGVRGDVVDQTLISTTILEIGPGDLTHQYTGRSIVIPNIMFLTFMVTNETFFHDFVLHTFAIPRHLKDDLDRDEEALLKACETECGKYIAPAQRDMDRRTHKRHLESMSVRPRVTIKMKTADTVDLVVRVAVPFRLKGRIENAILKNFLQDIKQRETERQFQV